jgi:type VI secretion system protein ImpC
MARKQSAEATVRPVEEATPAGGFLDGIIAAGPKTVSAEGRDRAREAIVALIDDVLKGEARIEKNVIKTIQARINAIDAEVSKQLAAIMHHEAFTKLEGSWRGLHHLVMNSSTDSQLKLRVLNVSKRDLARDLERATEFDQSEIFKKTYTEQFDMPGGEPYGALIGDYEFTNHPEDIDLLTRMSGVAAAGFCPFISAADPQLLGLESFSDLSKPRDLEKPFLGPDYAKWRSFRDSEDSRFVVLTMPRTLARMPYGKNTKMIEEFNFEEVELDEQGRSKPVPHDNYCWMNTAYVYGTRLTDSFAQHGWCTAIRGRDNGGTVEGLPTHIFVDDEGDLDMKCPTEVAISGRREAELSKLGFLALCHNKNTDFSVFYGGQTVQKPKQYNKAEATENAAISARVPYILATCRIAHFLKMIARDKIGSFLERDECEKWLNNWIASYVATNNPSDAIKRTHPLAEARIDVEEIPGKPGEYNCKAYLRPWLQLETLTVALGMVARMPSGKA